MEEECKPQADQAISFLRWNFACIAVLSVVIISMRACDDVNFERLQNENKELHAIAEKNLSELSRAVGHIEGIESAHAIDDKVREEMKKKGYHEK